MMCEAEYQEYRRQCAQRVYGHPCYSREAHFRFGRVHLAVAPRCNIRCNYCVRRHDCANENRPGVASKILTPGEALERVREAVAREPRMRVVGIAGPGDPLANDATFETFGLVKREFPSLVRCLSTNGLLLPEKLEALVELGVTTLTITINAVDPSVGSQIYSYVNYGGRILSGEEAFRALSRNQLAGLQGAVEKGMVVKVNSVFIPGVNDGHLEEVARVVRGLGAYTMNIIPLIPLGRFAHLEPPKGAEVKRVRDACEVTISQFRHCIRCRADAVGVPGEESGGCASMELEV